MGSDKESLKNAASSIGTFLSTVDQQIKENKRQATLQKVMAEFSDPNKLFLNADGTPKSDAEISPKITQGVMAFYQLGEKDMASNLLSYYTNMSQAFNKDATNNFLYEQGKGQKLFPQDHKYDSRIDYSKIQMDKQYAPQTSGTWRLTPTTLPDGTFDYYYYNNKSGKYRVQDENSPDGFTETDVPTAFKSGKVDPTRRSVNQSSVSVTNRSLNSGQTQSYKDPVTGETHNVVFDNLTKKYTENGKTIDISHMTPMSENAPFSVDKQTNFFGTTDFKQFNGMLEQAFKDMNLTTLQYNQAMDYIMGKSTTYPEKLYELGFEGQINSLRQKYQNEVGF